MLKNLFVDSTTASSDDVPFSSLENNGKTSPETISKQIWNLTSSTNTPNSNSSSAEQEQKFTAIPAVTPTDGQDAPQVIYTKKKPIPNNNNQVRLPLETKRVPSVMAKDFANANTNVGLTTSSRSVSSVGFHHELPHPEYLDHKRHSLAVTSSLAMRSASPSLVAKNKDYLLSKPEITLIPATPMMKASSQGSSSQEGFFSAKTTNSSSSSMNHKKDEGQIGKKYDTNSLS